MACSKVRGGLMLAALRSERFIATGNVGGCAPAAARREARQFSGRRIGASALYQFSPMRRAPASFGCTQSVASIGSNRRRSRGPWRSG
jgi:hypothetical protein